MIVVGFWKILGVYFFIHVIFVFWAWPQSEKFYNPRFPNTVSAVLTA